MSDDLTFKEIAQIALGGVDLNSVNVSLLYALIDLLLKKLDCEKEKVVISGIPAECLQELLLESSTGPPLVFSNDEMQTPIKPFEKLDGLDKQIEHLETNLDEHLEQIKHLKYVRNDSDGNDSGIIPCTLLCDVEEPKIEVVSALLKDKWFLTQLNKVLKFPFGCRLNKLDFKFRKLEADIKEFQKECTYAHIRMDKMEDLFFGLLEFQKAIKENHVEFLTTMEEIQEVMVSKVNNLEMPPLKRSIQAILRRLANEANFLKYLQTKPRALACILDPMATEKVSRSILRRFTREPRFDKGCGCDEALLHTRLSDRVNAMDKKAILRRSTMDTVSFKGGLLSSSRWPKDKCSEK